MDIYSNLRTWLVRVVSGIMVLSTIASTSESYMGLRAWAAGHGYIGAGSFIFPGFIDAFPLAAEGVLIIAYIDGWRGRARIMPWCVLTVGLVVSVGLQVGQVVSPDVWTKATHGTPPMAAWLSLLVGMAMFKRVMANRPKPVVAEQEDEQEVPEFEDDRTEDELEPVNAMDTLDLQRAAHVFAADIKAKRVPGLNRIRTAMHCGHNNAPKYQAHLRELAGQEAA